MSKKPFVTKEQVEEIVKTYPTPFHLYDEKGIRENAKALKEAFAWNPGYKEYFAVKATPNPFLLQILKEYGCGCDCSSYTELLMSDAVGIDGHDIMFSSNDTPEEDFKLADKLGLDLKSIDMFEINEAFASQAYAVSRDLGLDPEKVNIYGGGISIGHPIGATGAMLTVKVMYELMRTDKKDAMISMCIGGGQGISMYFTKCEA